MEDKMTKIDIFKKSIEGKNITVIGIGISNLPLIRFLAGAGANVTACDAHDAQWLGENYEVCKELGVKTCLGDGYLENLTDDIIFKTPGMRIDRPELVKAAERGARITSEMETFFELCPSHIIAVTGSDGKTTTTTIIHKMLKDAGYRTWLGGNIGHPLLSETGGMRPEDYVVLELSSFQLHTMKCSPEIAVITNLSPNHLDWHTDYNEYIEAKTNIYKYMATGNRLILNADNADSAALKIPEQIDVEYFSRSGRGGIHLDGDMITYRGRAVLDIRDINIPGMHNVENYMAAIGAVAGLVSDDIIVKTAKEFGGVPHRIELVRTLDGVKYYNSSIDSSPNRTINTLNVFPEKVIMIAGGKDKGIPYDAIGEPIADHVKTLILIGATSGKIKDALASTGRMDEVEIFKAASYEEAVNTARNSAKAGDVVLLSPASTSFDMFRNFEERGNLFKQIVNELN